MNEAPLADVSSNHPLVVAITACVGVAVTMGTAVAQALRFSSRIASAEEAATSAVTRAAAAESLVGKLADEIRALRSERPSQGFSEAEIQRRVDDAVERATERLEDDVKRLRDAADRGLNNHHQVELAVARLSVAIERTR